MNRSFERNVMRRAAGFSLIEIMVTVAIIGILAAIALPSYNEHVRKTRRAGGTACLAAAAQEMERFYTVNLTYVGGPAAFACDGETAPFYNVTSVIPPNGREYTLTANRQGAQATDSCGNLTLNQAGVKTPATAGCW